MGRGCLALPPSQARLPQEDSAPDFAFADNVGRSVAAKAGGSRFFATMQWRHNTPLNQGGDPAEVASITTNGVCRVHLTEANGTVDRLATVACEPAAGLPTAAFFGVHSLAFGRFAVGMNSDLYGSQTWRVPPAVVGMAGSDLRGGQRYSALPATVELAANQTAIIFLDE